MKLETLVQAINPLAVKGSLDRAISGIAYDSRQVRKGALFVALGGRRLDGWSFVPDAIERGAVAVLSESGDTAGAGVCFIRVADARDAMARIADVFHGEPSRQLRVVGITGTNGKTTTAYMVREILDLAGQAPGLLGTVDYRIGARSIPAVRTTPESVDLQAMLAEMLKVGCRSVVMEVSSHAALQKRIVGVRFDAGVFTNLTVEHLDYHRTMEHYFEAKAVFIRAVGGDKPQGRVAVNIDNEWGRRLAGMAEVGRRALTFGLAPAAAVHPEGLQLGAGGSRFTCVTPAGSVGLELRLLGRYNVSNALGAMAVATILGVPPATAAAALMRMGQVPGRLEEIPTGRGFQVFVDYAHTDDALQHVLRTLREIVPGRLLLVFGCGGDRDRTKRPAMGRVASELSDYFVITSDNPRREDPMAIIDEIRAGIGGAARHAIVENRSDAIARVLEEARAGDIVLVAGKGHECFQEFANRVVPFDDREKVREWLARHEPARGTP